MSNIESNHIAIITGGAQGLGLSIGRGLAMAGFRVALIDRNVASLRSAQESFLAEHVFTVAVDLRDINAPQAIDEAVRAHWGAASVLVNNAGVASPKRNGKTAGILQLTAEEWDDVIDVNLSASFRMSRQFLPAMVEHGWGRVINIASLAGRSRSIIAGACYMAAKAGLIGLTRSIASEFGPSGVTANCVAPGLIDTPMAAARSKEANDEVIKQIPVRRMGKPNEVAAAVCYLASEEAGFVNGAVIDINGGVFMS